ncbi:DUF4199 domain-containing protein [Algoriphagus halophytocola]|uniref:DUF4199 domain-containing protein n=1 Tax=Algoriphagus halophytocola TaxID=2991499 RepID=A0ABY6MLP9_9BACT|nr:MULTISPECIES: DUF4199 domain-containing protein [unclassified Algoriphagus]UZD24692.1 DUF4199 domain-containing protein [Algoriphagus sp. TR-M5]WBL42060.1 DUF4199 domain-containing protein [Algoriphagus sp. TR-M9]
MEEQQSPFQAAVKPGLTIGLVSLAITFIAYFINSSLLASGWFGLVALAIFFVLIIYFGKQYRTELGGFMSFGTAFNFSFITMVISGLISTLGSILLFQVIDPSLPQVLADESFNTTIEMMEKFGASADSLPPEQLEEIKKSTMDGFTIGGQLKGFGISLIVYAIIALILGAILKKRDKSLDY